jgi:branched-chain amino acid transport system ATP-binding protein
VILEAAGICGGYGEVQVLWDVELRVARGEWVALLGAVGAGKTTLMRTLAGVIRPSRGTVSLANDDVTRLPPYERVRRGLSLVPEGRRLFRGMTVAENLAAGAFVRRDRRLVAQRLDAVFGLFPVLAERRGQQVGTLSGGEQQMCAIGRALMSGPQLLLVDELSLGLSPIIVDKLLDALVRIRAEGTTLVVVEQDVETSLAHADRGYLLRNGSVVLAGDSASLSANTDFRREFLGV